MLNEKLKQYTDKSESSDAERRCGRIGSSDEPAVMAEERRDSVIYTSEIGIMRYAGGRLMPEIDTDVKNWFHRVCRDFASLKFLVQDTHQKESIAFAFPATWRSIFGDKQPATVQYMGETSKKPKRYKNLEVRLYREPLCKAGLWEIIENAKITNIRVWKENGDNSYYAYKLEFEDDYDRLIVPIIQKMTETLAAHPSAQFAEQPVAVVPDSVCELPRY